MQDLRPVHWGALRALERGEQPDTKTVVADGEVRDEA